MRKYQSELKLYLMNVLLTARRELGFTQEQMASAMRMTPRSYSGLERGEAGPSAVSFAFLLYQLPPSEAVRIIRGFGDSIKELELKEAG